MRFEDHLCGGIDSEHNNTDTCQGDSGGAKILLINRRFNHDFFHFLFIMKIIIWI